MFNRSIASHRRPALPRTARVARASALAAMAALCAVSPGRAQANIVITAAFDDSIKNDPNAAAIEGTINSAIGVYETHIATPINVSIYFQEASQDLDQAGFLSANQSSQASLSYYDFYNALKAVATAPGASKSQQTAFASLGAAPAGETSDGPVNNASVMFTTTANARALGFSPPLNVQANKQSYDSVISFNSTITSPGGPNTNSTYSLRAAMEHDIDEALGIGGGGSDLSTASPVILPGDPFGPLDLYRYSAPGVRSFSNSAKSAYFSIDGGNKVLSYFNQNVNGELADYGDWLSDPIPAGYGPQVQDAFAIPGADPALGINEYTSFEAVGYTLAVPEPSTMGVALCGILPMLLRRRRSLPTADAK